MSPRTRPLLPAAPHGSAPAAPPSAGPGRPRRRRVPSAIVALVLGLSGVAAAGAPASAEGPAYVVDDFVAPAPGNRSVEANGATLTDTAAGTAISVTPGGGTRYAQLTWTFATPVDLTQGGTLTQMQLDYSAATGVDSTGQKLSNPIMMGLYVYDSSGRTKARGGTGVIPGSGTFVTNFVQSGPNDARYLEGNGDLTHVSRVVLFVGTSGNQDRASITVEWLAAVARESSYTVPSFTGPSEIRVERGQAVSATVTATGYPRPTVTTSGSLPPGVTATQTGTSVAFTGTPTTTGTWTYTVAAKTLDWLTGQQTVTFQVFTPPTLTGTTTLTGQVGVDLDQTLTVSGDPLPTSVAFTPPLPDGLTAAVSGATVHITGKPTTPGHVVTTASVSNGFATAVATLDITVRGPATLPALTDTLVAVGDPITAIEVTAGGFPAPTVSVAGLPAGLTAVPTTGGTRITGTPSSTGSSTVTVTADNGVGPAATASFALRVASRPVVTAAPTVTTGAGAPFVLPVTVTGDPAPSLVALGLPTGLALTQTDGVWAVRGAADRSAMGTRNVTFQADNVLGTGTATTTLTVTAPPLLVSQPASLDAVVGAPFSTTFVADGFPVPTLSVTGLPDGLTAASAGPGRVTVSGVPTASGVVDLTVGATSTAGSTSAVVQLTVGQVPVLPDAPVTVTLREGTAATGGIAATAYPAAAVRVLSGSLPTGVTLRTDGTLSGSPAAGTADAGSGRYEVVVRAENSHGSDDATLVVVVLSPPTVSPLPTATFAAGTAGTYTFTTGGWDRPTVTAVGLPDGLTLSQVDATTWQVSGTAARADLGRNPVVLTLENAYGRVTKDLDLAVTAPFVWDAAPSEILLETHAVMTPLRVNGTGYPAPTGIGLTGTGAWPTGVDSQQADWTDTVRGFELYGTPVRAGVFPLTIEAGGASFALTVRVVDRPVIDVVSERTVLADAAVDIPVTVTGSPAALATASGLPAGLSLVGGDTPGDWRVVGTPPRTAVGTYAVTIAADNGLRAARTLTLTVGATPVLPPSATAQLTLGTPVDLSAPIGGTPPPTVDVVGDLPAGLRWSADGGMARLTGTPTVAGRFVVTARATNKYGTDAETYTLVVQQGAAFADDTVDLALVEGVPATTGLPLAGFPVPALVVTGEVPGMSLQRSPGADPVLAGTPAPGSAGSYVLTVRAKNAVDGADVSDEVTVRVRVDARPAFRTGTEPLAAAVGSTVDRAIGVGGAPLATVTATGLPAGLTLVDEGTGTWRVTGTPARGSGGRHVVRLTADNGVLDPVAADVTVTVQEAVTAVRGGSASVRIGEPVSVPVAAEGGWPTPPALRVVGGLPAGVTFVDDGDGTGRVVGVPAAGTVGTWAVTVEADNGVGVASAQVTVTVTAIPAPPYRPALPGTGGAGLLTGGSATGGSLIGGSVTPPAGSSGGRASAGRDAVTGPGSANPADGGAGSGDAADVGSDAGSDDASADAGSGDGASDEGADAAVPRPDVPVTVSVDGPSAWWWAFGSALLAALAATGTFIARRTRGL